MKSQSLETGKNMPMEAAKEAAGPAAVAVREGLAATPKRLPPWLFYDAAGSRLFEQITRLPEYYLTRAERGIFQEYAEQIVELASDGLRLRVMELGAGSADKTRLLLAAVLGRQGGVAYEPVDVSASALDAARTRIEREMPGVAVMPQVMDYTREFATVPLGRGERRMVLYIGSSIGNYDPEKAKRLLVGLRERLRPGDTLLLGADLVKQDTTLLAAYDDAAGVTAAFNRNLLARMNRELGADFDLDSFAHRVVWNETQRRIEMHLESRTQQTVHLAGLNMQVKFERGERIHTENSYKYLPGEIGDMLRGAGFRPVRSWTDAHGWFEVSLGRAE